MLNVLDFFIRPLRHTWIRTLALMRNGRVCIPNVAINIGTVSLRLAMLQLLLLQRLFDQMVFKNAAHLTLGMDRD